MKNFLSICPHLAVNMPFIENVDGARVQMSASQCRQAVPLVNNEIPMVVTTFEDSDILIPDIQKSKKDGVIVFCNERCMIIKYIDDTYDIFRLFYDYTIKRNDGEVKQGEVLAYKTGYFVNGSLAQGKNLLTAIMSHPDTYEDAIVMSKSAIDSGLLDSYQYVSIDKSINATDILLSIDNERYKPIPFIHDKFRKGDPLLKIKNFSSNVERLYEPSNDVIASNDCEIVQVDVVPYKFNNMVREYEVKMKEYQYNNKQLLKEIESKDLPDYIMYKFKTINHIYNYDQPVSNNKTNIGVHIKMTYRTIERPEVGDKFSNRYANKGVISKLLPDNEMPVLSDGRIAQVIINPMSIISRMNIGQLYEVAASNCIYKLILMILESKESDLENLKELILRFYATLDNTTEKFVTYQMSEFLSKVKMIDDLKMNVNEFVFPSPPFESTKRSQLLEAMDILGVKDLVDAKYLGNDIQINAGYMYFYRLMHIASHKISGRSIGSFSPKTFQPVGGRHRGGGQRFGEMEVWTLMSYGSLENLREIISVKSDDMTSKLSYVYSVLYNSSSSMKAMNTESYKLLQSYLSILGVKLNP